MALWQTQDGPRWLEGSTKVCIECIGQFTGFVCSSRTRKRVRLVHTKPANCPLQSTQHSLCDPSSQCGPPCACQSQSLTKMNLHNRKMMLFLISGLICLMTSILIIAFVAALRSTTLSIEYMLYRYIAAGEYANAPVDYLKLILPAILIGLIGILLCLRFLLEPHKKQ